MSLPHTGKLTAILDGKEYLFNGDTWTAQDPKSRPDIESWLNKITDSSPKHHYTIREIASNVLNQMLEMGFFRVYVITHFESDTWDEELPPGAID